MLEFVTTGAGEQTLLMLGGVALLLVLLGVLLVLRRRKPRRTAAGARAAAAAAAAAVAQKAASSVAPVPLTISEAQAQPAPSAVQSPSTSSPGGGIEVSEMEVSEADLLSEVAIYLEYGYLDRAAVTLRYFVNEMGSSDPKVLRQLLEVYLHLGQIDAYADVLDRLSAAGEPVDFVLQSVIAGLKADPENLQLRVLAEYRLGLGVDQLNPMLGVAAEVAAPKVEEKPAAKKPEAPVAVPAKPQASPPQHGAKKAVKPRPTGQAVQLVRGDAGLEPLSVDEKAALRAFADPLKETRLHMALRNLDDAMVSLRRAIDAKPEDFERHKELLKICYAKRDRDQYAKAMWRLFTVLRGRGQSLRERLLSIGFSMGTHPALEALAQAKDMRELEGIGRTFGYHSDAPRRVRKLYLIESVKEVAAAAGQGRSQDVMKEVDSLLEFGQIDQALVLLERAVLEMPQVAQLYPPLLELYERMDDSGRLAALASKIKKRAQRPPEEVVVMMTSLYQRLKQRRQQAAA